MYSFKFDRFIGANTVCITIWDDTLINCGVFKWMSMPAYSNWDFILHNSVKFRETIPWNCVCSVRFWHFIFLLIKQNGHEVSWSYACSVMKITYNPTTQRGGETGKLLRLVVDSDYFHWVTAVHLAIGALGIDFRFWIRCDYLYMTCSYQQWPNRPCRQ